MKHKQNKKHKSITKQIIETRFWNAFNDDDLINMQSACTSMAKINDGDSYRLYQVMQSTNSFITANA